MSRTLSSAVIAGRRAFTMIELLVVIGIIAVLVGLSLVVGGQVMSGGKQRLTADAISVLDKALTQYIAEKGEIPPALFQDSDPANANKRFPVADARDMSNTFSPAVGLPGNQMINSVGFFYEEASKVPSVRAILDKLPAQLVRKYDADGPGTGQPAVTTVFDGWGRPIRFVHPTWQGLLGAINTPVDSTDVKALPVQTPALTYAIARIRRNHEFNVPGGTNAQDQPDSDGAQCKGNRPYFYSVGPDGVAGVKYESAMSKKVVDNYNADNVYGIQPNFTDK